MATLLIMKLTVISLLFFLFINSVFASSFDFSFNEINKISEEMQVSINKSLLDYDSIKIYVHNSSDPKISRSEVISNTLNNGIWKDSWLYLNSSKDTSNYIIKLQSYSKNNTICVKIKQTLSNYIEEVCKPLSLDLSKEIPTYSKEETYSTNLYYTRIIFIILSFILVLSILIILSLQA